MWLEATGGRCPGPTGTVTGSGEATPGGPFTFEGSHCLEPQPGDSFTRPFIRLTDGRFAFNFVSGATLTGRLEGYLYLQETGLYNIQADLWFEGGTGQFAYPASGSGGSFEQVDPAPMLDRQTGQGTNVRFEYGVPPLNSRTQSANRSLGISALAENGTRRKSMPGAGLEPARGYPQGILSPLRLPISPPGPGE